MNYIRHFSYMKSAPLIVKSIINIIARSTEPHTSLMLSHLGISVK